MLLLSCGILHTCLLQGCYNTPLQPLECTGANVHNCPAGDDGSAAGPNIDDSTILFGPGVNGAPVPAPDSAGAGNTLAALLAALSPSRLCAHPVGPG